MLSESHQIKNTKQNCTLERSQRPRLTNSGTATFCVYSRFHHTSRMLKSGVNGKVLKSAPENSQYLGPVVWCLCSIIQSSLLYARLSVKLRGYKGCKTTNTCLYSGSVIRHRSRIKSHSVKLLLIAVLRRTSRHGTVTQSLSHSVTQSVIQFVSHSVRDMIVFNKNLLHHHFTSTMTS